MTTAEPQRVFIPKAFTASTGDYQFSASLSGCESDTSCAEDVHLISASSPPPYTAHFCVPPVTEGGNGTGDSSVNLITEPLEQGEVEVTDVNGDDSDYEETISCSLSVRSLIDDVPRTPKRPFSILDPSSPTVLTEILFVTVGVAALGLGIYVGYRCLKRH